jgi:hypothetical protein
MKLQIFYHPTPTNFLTLEVHRDFFGGHQGVQSIHFWYLLNTFEIYLLRGRHMSAPHTALAFSVPTQYVFTFILLNRAGLLLGCTADWFIHGARQIPWSFFDTAVNVLHIVVSDLKKTV